MGQALYRKYRTKSFDDVVGQAHVTNTLKLAVSSGRVSHAYLFTGPRGVGKTSVARILAHRVNDLPYTDESIHLDIIEIDAASNNGVEDVRELRDKTHTSPSSAKYKVYIIDEVHMLSKPAFNALLKTLEEPPAHVIFILATTEAHKLPQTIISRTQRFEFKSAAPEVVAERLAKIAKAEKIKVDKPALQLLARLGDGSFRDSISLLDQLASNGQAIDVDVVTTTLGLPPEALIASALKSVRSGRPSEVLDSLSVMRKQGVEATSAAKAVAEQLRIYLSNGQAGSWLTPLLRSLIEVSASRQPDISFEVAMVEAALTNAATEPVEPNKAETKTSAPSEPAPNTTSPSQPRSAATKLNSQNWDEILETIKNKAASLYTALRLADPSLAGNVLTLYFKFPLHQKKLEQAENKDLVAKTASSILGREISVTTAVMQPASKSNHIDAPLETISNIFGTSEVLES